MLETVNAAALVACHLSSPPNALPRAREHCHGRHSMACSALPAPFTPISALADRRKPRSNTHTHTHTHATSLKPSFQNTQCCLPLTVGEKAPCKAFHVTKKKNRQHQPPVQGFLVVHAALPDPGDRWPPCSCSSRCQQQPNSSQQRGPEGTWLNLPWYGQHQALYGSPCCVHTSWQPVRHQPQHPNHSLPQHQPPTYHLFILVHTSAHLPPFHQWHLYTHTGLTQAKHPAGSPHNILTSQPAQDGGPIHTRI
mmetsp:Transcript_21574/g.54933  ORF Transcript_21574/g.54933 Transcript_21574/m.54933 type:complete len:252 (+) Transcript_21574:122-877(+)